MFKIENGIQRWIARFEITFVGRNITADNRKKRAVLNSEAFKDTKLLFLKDVMWNMKYTCFDNMWKTLRRLDRYYTILFYLSKSCELHNAEINKTTNNTIMTKYQHKNS